MRNLKPLLALAVLVALAWWWQQHRPASVPSVPTTPTVAAPAAAAPRNAALPAFLPPQAHATLALIARGGPFPYRQDGVVFQNREGLLPQAPRGTYHEYTVNTPGSRDRGARRIITAGTPPTAYWYTDDHYRSFRRFEVPQ